MNPENREKLFEKFRKQEIDRLILSRIANFAIDLPDASVLIEIS
jgi:DNA excision repair protein ERCC-3